jgi:hypothetical protein
MFKISKEAVQATVSFLITKPYQETYQLINALSHLEPLEKNEEPLKEEIKQ